MNRHLPDLNMPLSNVIVKNRRRLTPRAQWYAVSLDLPPALNAMVSRCFVLVLLAVSNQVLASDIRIVNAHAWTGDAAHPWTETIIVRGNKIHAVGDTALADDFPDYQTIDARGALVLPGFIDNHTHFMDGSASLLSVKTQDARSEQAFIDIIKAYAAPLPQGQWIVGGLWDHEAWDGRLPQRAWIDEDTQNNPLFLLRTDGHMALANSAALKKAGITRDTPDPDGGTIVRDEHGEPTGVLKDNAMNVVFEVLPPLTDEHNAAMFDAGVAEGLANGVTQVHNMGRWEDIRIFEQAKAQGRLKLRTYFLPPISKRHELAKRIAQHGKGDDWLRFGGVKELVDGSLGSTTAWFYEPYSDEPGTRGFALMPIDELKTSLVEAHALGLQLAIHGIGDQTNDVILKLFAQMDLQDSRPRIEHAQHLTAQAVAQFAPLGVIASMHPYHAIDDGRWAEKRIGAERLNGTYAFKSLLDAKAILSFGSDWSVAPLNPIAGIYAAVTRRTLDGKHPDGWVPQQKISVEEAVRAYTVNNAWAGFQEAKLGTLTAGKLADLVILSDNLFEIDPKDIINATVTLTMVDGEIAYRQSSPATAQHDVPR